MHMSPWILLTYTSSKGALPKNIPKLQLVAVGNMKNSTRAAPPNRNERMPDSTIICIQNRQIHMCIYT